MNMKPPTTSWQEMNVDERYDLLQHALEESIWSLEPSGNRDELGDSQRLALEFVEAEGKEESRARRERRAASFSGRNRHG